MKRAKLSAADLDATFAVTAYTKAYMANRGLVAMFPRLSVAMMRSLSGWAVRNADGGADIAFFSSREVAESCISRLHRDLVLTPAGMLSA